MGNSILSKKGGEYEEKYLVIFHLMIKMEQDKDKGCL